MQCFDFMRAVLPDAGLRSLSRFGICIEPRGKPAAISPVSHVALDILPELLRQADVIRRLGWMQMSHLQQGSDAISLRPPGFSADEHCRILQIDGPETRSGKSKS